MEKSEGHLSVQVGVLRPWWWSRVGQLQFPATLLQMCHEEWRPMGLQHVCANFMRIVNSPVLYMSKFFPIRIATDAYVRYVSKCTMSLITVWSCLCCWTLVIHEGLFRLHVHGLHIDCTRQCHGSHPANGRSSTCSHIWQMHVLSPLDSTSILYRHVVCLRLCCACSFFPFETQTHCTNLHRLSRKRVSLGISRLLSLAIVDKEHIAIGSEADAGRDSMQWHVYVLVFSHGALRKIWRIGVGLETTWVWEEHSLWWSTIRSKQLSFVNNYNWIQHGLGVDKHCSNAERERERRERERESS